MPRDLFETVGAAPRSTTRGRLVPWSIALHVVLLAVIVIAPLLAVGELPPPRAPLAFRVTTVVLPQVPVPAGHAAGAHRAQGATAAAVRSAPLTAPPSITPEPLPSVTEDGASAEMGDSHGVTDGIPGGVPGGVAIGQPVAPPPVALRRVGGDIKPPRKIRDVRPVYPTIAQQAGVQGIVIIDAVIGPDGRVRDTRVLRSVPLLDEAALRAVREWEFTPTRLNGEAVAVAMTITVQFTLSR